MRLKKAVWSFCAAVLLLSSSVFGNFYCKYSCANNKGREAAKAFLKDGSWSYGDCLEKCSTQELVPFFCEFFPVVLSQSKSDDALVKKLSSHFLSQKHDNRQPISEYNNYSYHILRNVTPSVCRKRFNIMSTVVPEADHASVERKLEVLLKQMHQDLEARYTSLKKSQQTKATKVKKLPKSEACETEPDAGHHVMRLFNWCYNYCNGERAAKTYTDLKELIEEHPQMNPGDIIDEMKKSPTPFLKHKHKYARRAYKCLTQCPVKHIERYMYYFVDEIDILHETKDDLSKKMLDVFGQILLMTPHKDKISTHRHSKLSYYLKHPQYKARCSKMFKGTYYRGMNYRINVDYLKNAYLV